MNLAPDSAELADAAGAWKSAYVHVPFCARVCPYCDFAVVAGQDDLASPYVDALEREIGMAEPWDPLDAVFVGGGTPSRLEPSAIERVLSALDQRFGLAADVEVTMEANPEDITDRIADAFASSGVTRLSLGVQSFDDAVLSSLGRMHTSADAMSAVSAALATFEAVSVDLIYGHPTETDASWDQTIRTAIDLGPEHISAYSLTVELGTALSREVASGAPAPDDDVQADRWERAAELLGATYTRYEVSNYAVAEPCRYNLATWAQGEYDAFGVGAHGHRAGRRTRNVRRLDRYLERVDLGERPLAGFDVVDGWDRERERLMLGLRRSAGVWAGRGGQALVDQEPDLVRHGLVKMAEGRLVVERPLLTDMVVRAALAVRPPE